MTRLIYVEEAEQGRVSASVARIVEELGGVVDTHTPSVVEFEHMNPGGAYSFSKSGYVGIYQELGEKGMELLIEVFAASPRRLFWTTVLLELLLIGLIFAAAPPTQVWYFATLALWPIFVVVSLIYVGTWYSSGRLERELFERLRLEVSREGRVLSRFEIEEQELRTRILAKARIAQLKRAVQQTKRSSFSFRGFRAKERGAPPAEGTTPPPARSAPAAKRSLAEKLRSFTSILGRGSAGSKRGSPGLEAPSTAEETEKRRRLDELRRVLKGRKGETGKEG